MTTKPGLLMVIRTPGLIFVDGLTGSPAILIFPARQALVAAERVLNIRTDHSQASTRTGEVGPSDMAPV